MPETPPKDGPRKYDPKDPQSILEFGRRVIGISAREICLRSGMPDPSKRPGWKGTKNVLGDVMEWYYGIPKNNSPEPDFPQAKVELKILPLKRKGTLLAVKEPTSISMIDYTTLLTEKWQTATVRKKLNHVLFVFFAIRQDDLMASRVRAVVLWEPRPVDNAIFESDWTRTWNLVDEGLAHRLSESQAEALAARRKGMGGPSDRGRRQPKSSEMAKSRAWALKSGFTRQILDEWVMDKRYESAFEQFLPEVHISLLGHVEERVLSALGQFVGRQLDAIAERNGVKLTEGKNLAATIVKRSLGFKSVNSRIREFDQFGIDVKTLNLRLQDGYPFEAVSFPVVDLQELAKQGWEGEEGEDGEVVVEGSDLIDQVHLILFVPTYSEHRKTSQSRRVLGRPFFWSPAPEQFDIIQREWKMYQKEVVEGKARYFVPEGRKGRRNGLTPASRTKIIHMRPHGRNANDVYPDPRGNLVTKQCFWLNKEFVWKLVRENGAFPLPTEPGYRPKAP
jgi:DNA mismatch repair protein MutH